MSEQVILAIVAILATTVGALIWVIKYMFDKILPLLEKMDKSIEKNTRATESNDKYLRERNGRDSKMWVEVSAGLKALTESIKSS